MQNLDNSSYTVTAPDLMLSEFGFNVVIISSNEDVINSVKEKFERFIQSAIIFNLQQTKTNDSNLAWLYYVSGPADFLFIDIDTCEWIDICLALSKDVQNGKFVVFYGGLKTKKPLIKLLSALGNHFIVENMDGLEMMIQKELVPDIGET